MEIVLLTNEYPPTIYGGAGVHIDYLSKELAKLHGREHKIRVFCFGDQDFEEQNLSVKGLHHHVSLPMQDPRHQKFMDAMLRDVMMAGSVQKADIIHCHTWYTHFAGCLLKEILGTKLVLTTHSLEPHRPWKSEQLGSAYRASSWVEKTAYQNADGVIAVSESMKNNVQSLYDFPQNKIQVIHNGIDLDQYKPKPNPDLLRSYQIDPDRPYILFVGRVTRQKGIIHLIHAMKYLRPELQVVLCAGAPDTQEIGREMEQAVKTVSKTRKVIIISRILPREEIVSLYTHAAVFVCPSVYEPFGIINLEAMACETPVVASNVGGIPEIVLHNETGLLVPLDSQDGEKFSKDLADAILQLINSPEKMRDMGKRSRKRVEKYFSWPIIAQKTLEFYQKLSNTVSRIT